MAKEAWLAIMMHCIQLNLVFVTRQQKIVKGLKEEILEATQM